MSRRRSKSQRKAPMSSSQPTPGSLPLPPRRSERLLKNAPSTSDAATVGQARPVAATVASSPPTLVTSFSIPAPAPQRLNILGLLGEVRGLIYDHLLEGTKTIFNFRNSKMYALYKVEDYRLPGSPLPKWLLTSRIVLQEGIEQLQREGEVEMSLSYICSNDTSTVSMLIDPAKFQTLIFTSPSHDETFEVKRGLYRQRMNVTTHGKLLRLHVQHRDRIAALVDHLKSASSSRIEEMRIEFDNVARSKKHGLDLNPILELRACLPKLEKVELWVEQGVWSDDDYDPPDKWFFAFRSLVGALLGFGNFEVNTKSTVVLEHNFAADSFCAERKNKK